MNPFKLLGEAIVNVVKQTWLLPRTVAIAVRQRREQGELAEREVERLDRIRNPSKYLGK